MAHNIFHTGFDFIKDKTTDLVDNVKDFGTDLYVDYKVDQYVDSFTDEFKGPTTITPEMAAEGWKPGLDGVPYNSKLNEKFEPGGIFYDPDVDKNTAIANAVASGAVSSAEAGTEEGSPFLSQDLRQRTPSGTMYNPSMDDYNNASLFNYEGPGGVPEYTYGEALKTDYGTYGMPVGPNLYYEGQFGEGFVEPGVADTAITLPPITMPAGVPQIPTSNTNTTTNNNTTTTTNTGTYQSGMDSNLLNSYINESGIGAATQGSGMGYTGGVNEPGIGTATQGSGMGYSGGANEAGAVGIPGYTNNGTTSSADQAIFDAAKMSQMPDSGPSIYNTQYTPVPYQIGGEEQVSNAQYNMQPTDDGSFNYGSSLSNQANFENANNIYNPTNNNNNVIKNPNQETQPYKGIYVDPRTVPEIDLVESNVTYPPSFPAGYGDGNNINLLSTTDEEYDNDKLIMSGPMSVEEQAMGTNPELFKEDEEIVLSTILGELTQADLDAMTANGVTIDFEEINNNSNQYTDNEMKAMYGEKYNWGVADYASDGFNKLTSLFSNDEPSAEEVVASVDKEPSIWNSVMEIIAGTAGMGFPGGNGLYSPENSIYNNDSGMTMPPSFINEPTGNTEGQDMYDGFVQGASELASEFPTADPSITYSESPLFNTEIQNALMNNQPTVYNTPPVGPPSVISQPAPSPAYIPSPVNAPSIFTKPSAPAPVYAAPGGPPNRPSKVPSYTWKPSYAGGSGGF